MESNTLLPKIKIDYFSLGLICSLLILFLVAEKSVFAEIDNALPVYLISVLNIIFMMGYLYKFGLPKRFLKGLFMAIVSYILFLSFYSALTDIANFKYAFRIFNYMSLLLLFSLAYLNERKLIFIGIIFSIVPLTLILDWLSSIETIKYAGYFRNPNTLGIVVYNIFFFQLLMLFAIKNKIIKLIVLLLLLIDLILLYVSTSRSVWIAIIVAFVIYISYNVFSKYKISYRLGFIITLLSVITFSYFYPMLYTLDLVSKINSLVIEYTGKNLFSGRQIIWSDLIQLIEKKPLLGYGLSATAYNLAQTNHDAHNVILSILFQSGIIGLLLYSLMLYFLWDALYIEKNTSFNKNLLKLFPSFFIGLLVYQSFEMSFIKGGYSISMFEWLFVAIGISLIKKYNSNTPR